MDKRQEARFTMAQKAIHILDLNAEIWKDDTVVTNAVNQIKASIDDVNETLKQQTANTQGYTKSKKKFRSKVDDDLDYLLSAFRAYAKVTDNDVLYENSNFSPTKIEQILDTEIIPFAEKHLAYATAHLQELEPYGIREAGLKAAQKNMEAYEQFLSMPQDIVAFRAAATKKLKKELDDLVNLFDEVLDNMMVKYRRTNSEFYETYINARIIYDNPTHHKAIHGIVTDEETKEVLENVKVSFLHTESGTNVDKLPTTYTTAKGYYEFKSLPEGPGKVIFEMGYYDTLRMPVNLIPNNDLRLDVAIRKKE